VTRSHAVTNLSPQQRAERAAEAMWAADKASKWLGMTLDAVAPGRAEMSMTVEAHHTNGHGICHGGYVFTLADSAFAFACNSYNVRTVAAQNAITFVAPAREGDRLRAVAVEVVQGGRSGVYDVSVTNQAGTVVALMRGNSRQIGGSHFEEA
jgi:acyl-CoA thioesterase